MAIEDFLNRIEATGLSTAIREGGLLFPLFESMHVVALAFVVGSIIIVDLRLLGFASVKLRVTRLTNDLLPWTWGAFGCAVLTGLLLLSSTPNRYFINTPLRWKFFFMALAGINMLVFHFVTYKTVNQWDTAESPPAAARLAGGLSILLWVAVVFFGRWIGFTL